MQTDREGASPINQDSLVIRFLKILSPFHADNQHSFLFNPTKLYTERTQQGGVCENASVTSASSLSDKLRFLKHVLTGSSPFMPSDPQIRAGLFDYLTLFSFSALNGWLTKINKHLLNPLLTFLGKPDSPILSKISYVAAFLFLKLPLGLAKIALYLARDICCSALLVVMAIPLAIKHLTWDRWHSRPQGLTGVEKQNSFFRGQQEAGREGDTHSNGGPNPTVHSKKPWENNDENPNTAGNRPSSY